MYRSDAKAIYPITVAALIETYDAEGVRNWLRTWLNAEEVNRLRMTRGLVVDFSGYSSSRGAED
jgi:hypothetical protein